MIERHFVFMFIIIYMILSCGCYAYTAYCIMIIIIMVIIFDLAQINPFKAIFVSLGEVEFHRIMHHIWIFSLFIGYFIYNQKAKDGLIVD